ncbi:MBL fold metallo-hydrolase [Methylocystaceae bacterium]|nr:MBL fold metallo-hydrolase [Methylocystaceae bacterium]
MKLSFLGAAGSVTGSRYLLEDKDERILIDCGLFQGLKNLRLRNWQPFPVKPKSITSVILTHAHIDHSGYLPLLSKEGFKREIYCSKATRELCKLLLEDSAHLQEQDADYANRKRFSKHNPARPLYETNDVKRCLKLFSSLSFDKEHRLSNNLSLTFKHSGHILGAASVQLKTKGKKIVFSGDIGRYNDPIMLDPEGFLETDFLVVESTYGNRIHDKLNPLDVLEQIVSKTIARGGTVIIPAFAVGRAQMILFYLEQLRSLGRISQIPIYLNSPMAIEASDILCRYPEDIRLSQEQAWQACSIAEYVTSVERSKQINEDQRPKIIISASGMATGGRVLHHLKTYAIDARHSILFVGFQAAGTRGANLIAGAKTIKIHGVYIPVNAEIHNLDMLSAHADADELMKWLKKFSHPPRQTFITHGEPAASDALRLRIQDELKWQVIVPEALESVDLG